eukprot:CAMPEP_0184750530 /NCGR_PEP_ID=MMETSP0315-20130426/36994_1 /TAXON_ID=101924 /ORGANISM="Rhodosorus marinus, Strain UTEX LB 2760" /LENGTH=34 /DNA_ID= /DNA_START= /DNA_END= /DNA_ORIENTATION=
MNYPANPYHLRSLSNPLRGKGRSPPDLTIYARPR